MGWASMRDRMNRKAMRTLTDGLACYTDKSGATVPSVPIMIDFNVERTGPEGIYSTDQVGITFNRADLQEAVRGAIFTLECHRFVVEEDIFDDGHFITVACMEQT